MREYLKDIRISREMSQQDVADSLSVSRQYYNLIENGDRQKNMDISLAAKLAEIFGVPVEKIIAEEEKLAKDSA